MARFSASLGAANHPLNSFQPRKLNDFWVASAPTAKNDYPLELLEEREQLARIFLASIRFFRAESKLFARRSETGPRNGTG